MKNRSLKLNTILNIVKQLCSVLFPLITIPYVTRILQATNYGKVNFSSSIISYFVLFAAFGINNYAIREGGQIR
ncbi:oligosaccharide flippase family protein, partial [Jutongia sp.]